jgi:hypothetical protein
VSERIENIRRAVEAMHACKAKQEKSDPVIVLYGDAKVRVWEGLVERFALTGHPQATHCYAWEFCG